MRKFRTEQQSGGKTVEWFSHEDGRITRKVTQDAQRVADAVHASSETARGKDMYRLGSIPETTALEWVREMGPGYTLYSREFAQYARRKLRDSDYRKFSTGVT